MKITKADFPEFVEFTQNLDEAKINHYINIAYERDVKPRLTDITLALIQQDTLLDEDELLWQKVRAYWVFAAYYRHSLTHGINHTQAGFTVAVGDRFEQITDKRRAELMAQVKDDRDSYETALTTYIAINYSTAETIDTCQTPKRKSRIGLRVVKAGESKRFTPVTRSLPPDVVTDEEAEFEPIIIS